MVSRRRNRIVLRSYGSEAYPGEAIWWKRHTLAGTGATPEPPEGAWSW